MLGSRRLWLGTDMLSHLSLHNEKKKKTLMTEWGPNVRWREMIALSSYQHTQCTWICSFQSLLPHLVMSNSIYGNDG